MSQRKRVGALEIHEDQKFQERAWLVQRIGWALMFLVLLAALAGIFGGGYLSRVTAESENLKIEYDRFPRRLGTTMLKAQVTKADSDGFARLWLDLSYMERFEIQEITPEPDNVRIEAGRLLYAFRAQPGTPAEATFRLKAERPGSLHGRAGATGGSAVEIRHFIYP